MSLLSAGILFRRRQTSVLISLLLNPCLSTNHHVDSLNRFRCDRNQEKEIDSGCWGWCRPPRGNFVCGRERVRESESKSNKSNKAALWPSPENQIQFYQDTH